MADSEIKEVVRDLWKDKPLAITVALGLAALVYILYKKNSANVVAPAAVNTAAAAPTGSGGTYVEESINYYAPTSITNPVTGPVAPPPVRLPGPIIGPPLPIEPPPVSQPPTPGPQPPTYGLLGPNVSIQKSGSGYTYKLPGGTTGNLISFLNGTFPGASAGSVRGGSQGRWWYISRNLKFLITSGYGGIVTNSGTNANA